MAQEPFGDALRQEAPERVGERAGDGEHAHGSDPYRLSESLVRVDLRHVERQPAPAVVRQHDGQDDEGERRRADRLAERPRLLGLPRARLPRGLSAGFRDVVAVRQQPHLFRRAADDQRIRQHEEHDDRDAQDDPHPPPAESRG